MITRLYIERLPDGGYDVVCNDLYTTVTEDTPHWAGIPYGVESAIEVLTQPHLDECEDENDVAGIRVGYQARGMFAIAYDGEVWWIPEFRLADAMTRLAGEVAE